MYLGCTGRFLSFASALFLVGLSAAVGAERVVIPNCCSSTSSISLYSPSANAVTHTFELDGYVVNSAISRDGAEDYLVVSDSQTSLPTGLARLNLTNGNVSPVTSLPPVLPTGGVTSVAASPVAPVFYLFYYDPSGIPHLVCYSAKLAIVNQVTLPSGAVNQLYVSPKGDRIYLITGSAAKGVIEVDAKTLEVTRTLLPGTSTSQVAETADESTLFVYSAANPATIYATNVATGNVTESIPLTGIVNSFTAAADGSELFVINQSSVTTVSVPSQQAVTYTDNPNYGLGPAAGFSPDGDTLYLNVLGGGGFMEFNTTTGAFTPVPTPWSEGTQVSQSGGLVLQDTSWPGIVTGPVPSSTPALTFAGSATAAAWDEASNSVYLAVANSNVVQVLDDKTFQPKSLLTFSPSEDVEMLAVGGGYLYVGIAVSGEFGGPAEIVKCDPTTLAQLATFNLPPVSSYNAPGIGNGFVSPDGSKLYVEYVYTQPVTDLTPSAPQGGNQIGIAVFDTTSGAMLNNFPLTAPSALAPGKDGTTAYVSWQSGFDNRKVGISQLDLTTGAVVNSVTLYTSPAFKPPPVKGPMLSADGSVLLAVVGNGIADTELFVLDPATLAIRKGAALALVGLLAVTPDGHYLYAVEQGASLLVIDLTTFQIVSTQPVSQPSPAVALIM